MAASAKGTVDLVKTLLANGADVNAKTTGGETALKNASGVEIAKLLLDAGANQ
jgi:ankyrin repeat protein